MLTLEPLCRRPSDNHAKHVPVTKVIDCHFKGDFNRKGFKFIKIVSVFFNIACVFQSGMFLF